MCRLDEGGRNGFIYETVAIGNMVSLTSTKRLELATCSQLRCWCGDSNTRLGGVKDEAVEPCGLWHSLVSAEWLCGCAVVRVRMVLAGLWLGSGWAVPGMSGLARMAWDGPGMLGWPERIPGNEAQGGEGTLTALVRRMCIWPDMDLME